MEVLPRTNIQLHSLLFLNETTEFSNIEGQTDKSDSNVMTEGNVCCQSFHPHTSKGVPSIISGYLND